MGAAIFLVVVFYSLYRTHAGHNGTKHPSRSRLLAVWLLCLSAALVLTVKELSAPAPWHGPEDAPVRIYFSPHCPACMQAVEAAAASPLPVAYYPVATSLDEVKIILAMEEDLARGVPLADSLRKFRADPPRELTLSVRAFSTLWQILRNRADVLSLGKGSVPLILVNGVPQWGAKAPATPAPANTPAALTPPNILPSSPDEPDLPGIPFDFNTNQCDETTDADCVEQ